MKKREGKINGAACMGGKKKRGLAEIHEGYSYIYWAVNRLEDSNTDPDSLLK